MMVSKIDKYPNKEDYGIRFDKYTIDDGCLPLADPAESNGSGVFQKNQAKKADKHKQSAFGQNKKKK